MDTGCSRNLEEALVEVLGTPIRGVSPDVSLLGLGLDSLRAAELCQLVARRGGSLSLEQLLGGMTIGEFRELEPQAATPAGPPTVAATVEDVCGLTAAESSLYFLDELTRADDQVNAVTVAIWLPVSDEGAGRDPVAPLQQVLRRLAETHPALRTRFVQVNGAPRRMTDAEPPELAVESWTEVTDSAAGGFIEGVASKRLAPEHGAWWDAHLVHGPLGAAGRRLLVVRCHHAIVDLWSLQVLRDDLMRLVADPSAALDRGEHTMAEVVRRERERDTGMDVDLGAWRERLDGVPQVLSFPLDRPRPRLQRCHGTATTHRVDRDVAESLRRLALRWEVTLPSLLASAWASVLSRYCGQEDFLLGDVYAGRSDPALRRVVGCLADVVPCRVRAAPDDTFHDLAHHIARERAWGIDHVVPFARVVQATSVEREPAAPPLCQALFSFQEGGAAPDDAQVQATTRYLAVDLCLEVTPDERGLALTLDHAVDVVEPKSARRVLARVVHVLHQLLEAGPDASVREVTELRTDLAVHGQYAESDRARWSPLLHLPVLEHAARAPRAPAVRDGDTVLDYATLVARAAGVAHALRAAGAAPGTPVAVLGQREAALVVGALGALLAGCAFAPLAPDLPRDRLIRSWERLGRGPVVAGGAHGTALAAAVPGMQVIDVDAVVATAPPERAVEETDSPAYVLHTSGSSGEPKAVVVSHRAITSMFADFESRGRLGEAPVCSWWCEPGFDVSIYEIFLGLRTGGCVAIVPDEVRVDGEALVGWMVERRVQACFVPPFLVGDFADAVEHRQDLVLRRILLGVEPIPHRLVLRLAKGLPDATVVNAYGPTEAAVMSTAVDVHGPDAPSVTDHAQPTPIGLPLRGLRADVVDGRDRPVAAGAVGELVIGGDQVADGYLGDPVATAQCFVPDPGPQGGAGTAPGTSSALVPMACSGSRGVQTGR